MNLPIDIIGKIHEDFEKGEDVIVLKELNWRYNERKYFWAASVIRAILYLAKGDIKLFWEWLDTDDWRTILIHAEEKSGNYGHYFNPTFDEIKEITELMQREMEDEIAEIDNLPPDLFENNYKK